MIQNRNFVSQPRQLSTILEIPETQDENSNRIVVEENSKVADSLETSRFAGQCAKASENMTTSSYRSPAEKEISFTHVSPTSLLLVNAPHWREKAKVLGFVLDSNPEAYTESKPRSSQNTSTAEMEIFFPEFCKYREILSSPTVQKYPGVRLCKGLQQQENAQGVEETANEELLVQSWLNMFGGS